MSDLDGNIEVELARALFGRGWVVRLIWTEKLRSTQRHTLRPGVGRTSDLDGNIEVELARALFGRGWVVRLI